RRRRARSARWRSGVAGSSFVSSSLIRFAFRSIIKCVCGSVPLATASGTDPASLPVHAKSPTRAPPPLPSEGQPQPDADRSATINALLRGTDSISTEVGVRGYVLRENDRISVLV